MTHSVVVVGAGGFGRETLDVVDALVASGTPLTVQGVVDDSPSLENLNRLNARGVNFLGSIDSWRNTAIPPAAFLIGIGNPTIRERLTFQLLEAGHTPFTAIHPLTRIGSEFTPSEGIIICAGASISTNVQIGRFSHVNPGAIIGHDTTLGEHVSINPGAIVSGEVVIGDSSLIGAGAIVLQGLTVGENVTIGAGSVVTRDVPNGVTVKGVPGVW